MAKYINLQVLQKDLAYWLSCMVSDKRAAYAKKAEISNELYLNNLRE
jgi:hypothetical protein